MRSAAADGETNAELPSPFDDRLGHQTVEPDRGQRETEPAEE